MKTHSAPAPRPPLRQVAKLPLILLILAGAAACKDSDGSSTSSLPGTVSVSPPDWTTHPGRVQTFDAIVNGIAPGVRWAVPPGFGVVDEDSDSITLAAPGTTGDFELVAVSIDQPQLRRVVPLRVDPYGFSFRLADGPPGDSSQRPFADGALSRDDGLGDPPRVYLAWCNDVTGANTLRTYDPAVQGQVLPPLDNLFFNPLQVPHVTADAQGNAYWIQQYFYHPFRWYQIGRLDSAGGVVVKDYDASAFGDWWLAVGSDIASDDDGVLHLLVEKGGVHRMARLSDFFGASPSLELLEPVSGAPDEVRFSVDTDGRLLVADVDQLSRWTFAAGGPPTLEPLATLPGPVTDVDSDGNDLIYVSLPTQLLFVDTLGREAFSISSFTLDSGPDTHFQDIQGIGVDARGNLRVLDKPMTELPLLPVRSLLPYLIDLPPDPQGRVPEELNAG